MVDRLAEPVHPACRLKSGGQIVDQYDTPFGVRTIEYDVNKGFFLNGRHVKLNGVCLHGDGGAVGVAVPFFMAMGIGKQRQERLFITAADFPSRPVTLSGAESTNG